MPDRFSKARELMIRGIEADVVSLSGILGKKKLSTAVIDAISKVSREKFVSSNMRKNAYQNCPLSIGFGQTISQPFVVAAMTDMLAPHSNEKILEIGTGCGYQTAVLAELTGKIVSVERIRHLADTAGKRLARLGYKNVCVRVGNGWNGWSECAPYDAIIVAAAAPEVPVALLDQLRPEGRLVIPIGEKQSRQHLKLIKKDAEGNANTYDGLPVYFVPLVQSD